MKPATVHPSESFKNTREADGLLQNIGRYWRYGGAKYRYIPSLLLHPSYHDLEWKRLRYYFYWRQSLFEGECLDADAGYIWLHCVELLTVNDDPLENMRCLVRMRDSYQGQDPAVDSILESACSYYATAIGYVRRDAVSMNPGQRSIRICRVLSDRTFLPLSAKDLRFLVPSRGRRSADTLRALGNVVSAALHEIGRPHRGILRLCMRTAEHNLRFPFSSDMGTYGMKGMYVKYEDLKESEMFMGVFKEVYDECDQVISNKKRVAGGRYAQVLNECINAYFAGTLDPEPYDKYGAPMAYHKASYYLDYKPAELPERDGTWPSYRFRSRMLEYGEIPTPQTDHFRAPKTGTPCYSSMTLDEYIGYQSWKDRVLKGDISDMKEGFAWLLSNEILNDDSMDPEDTLEVLEAFADRPDEWQRGMPDDLVADWCLMHGLYSTRLSRRCENAKLSAMTSMALKSSPPLPLSREQVDRVSVRDADGLLVGTVNAAIRSVYEANGNSLGGAVDLSTTTSVVEVFRNCAGMPVSVDAETPANVADVNRFVTSVCKIAEAILSGDKDPKTPGGLGRANRDAAVAGAIDYLKRSRLRKIARSGVSLDMDMVRSAADDLSAVTEMMRIEEEDETPAREAPAAVLSGDPWKDLMVLLTPEALEYLRLCVKGTKTDVLKEKAVNEAAMETVGDPLVEDGKVSEDYEEDILNMLRNDGSPERLRASAPAASEGLSSSLHPFPNSDLATAIISTPPMISETVTPQ